MVRSDPARRQILPMHRSGTEYGASSSPAWMLGPDQDFGLKSAGANELSGQQQRRVPSGSRRTPRPGQLFVQQSTRPVPHDLKAPRVASACIWVSEENSRPRRKSLGHRNIVFRHWSYPWVCVTFGSMRGRVRGHLGVRTVDLRVVQGQAPPPRSSGCRHQAAGPVEENECRHVAFGSTPARSIPQHPPHEHPPPNSTRP